MKTLRACSFPATGDFFFNDDNSGASRSGASEYEEQSPDSKATENANVTHKA